VKFNFEMVALSDINIPTYGVAKPGEKFVRRHFFCI
jgi:hypothetical protein